MNEHPGAIFYLERGMIERGPRYEWRMGYSENGENGAETQPWLTWRECQADAKQRGKRAVFVRSRSTEAAP